MLLDDAILCQLLVPMYLVDILVLCLPNKLGVFTTLIDIQTDTFINRHTDGYLIIDIQTDINE